MAHARDRSATDRRGTGRTLLLILGLSSTMVGCVRRIPMSQVEGDDGEQPHTVVLYSGVRDGSRRYADYGVIDAKILTEEP